MNFPYAMTGKLTAQPGMGKQLADVLLRASQITARISGCRAYIVSSDAKDESVIWVFEIWEDKASHDASLRNENVRALIAEAMPMLAAPPDGSELRVLGGFGKIEDIVFA